MMTAGRFVVICTIGLAPLFGTIFPSSGMATEPVIACPPGPVTVSTSKMGQVTIDLPIQGADSVYMPAGSWKNGRFTFVASRQGPWALTVSAFSGGEQTSCVIHVNVRFAETVAPQYADEAPAIVPPEPSVQTVQAPIAECLNSSPPQQR